MKQRMPHFTSQKPTNMGIPLRRLLKHGICFKKEKKQGGTSTSGQPKQQVSPFSLQQKEKKKKKNLQAEIYSCGIHYFSIFKRSLFKSRQKVVTCTGLP